MKQWLIGRYKEHNEVREEQFGFISVRPTIDPILILRKKTEKKKITVWFGGSHSFPGL